MNLNAVQASSLAPPVPPSSPSADGVLDALWGGRLPFWQPARGCGYRFNLDPILLANFLPAAGHLVDLGAGVGIIGLLALALGRAERLTAIERQPQLATLLRRNVLAQHVEARVTLYEGDLRDETRRVEADLAVFNPPYFAVGRGRPCHEAGRDQGRREVFGSLTDFVSAGASATRARGGSVAAIVPWARKLEIEEYFCRERLSLARTRPICPRVGDSPSHLMTLAGHAGCSLVEMDPLIVHQAGTLGYSDEVKAWLIGPSERPEPVRLAAGSHLPN